MKSWKIDNYKITAKKLEGKSNFLMSVNLFNNGFLIKGTTLKNESTDIQILDWGIEKIKLHQLNIDID